MADANLIGLGSCPICGSTRARFTFSKKELACIVCNACQFQGFARSDNSDMRLRALVKPTAPAVEEKPAPAVEKPAPAATEKVADSKKETVAAEAQKTEKTKPWGLQWGVLKNG